MARSILLCSYSLLRTCTLWEWERVIYSKTTAHAARGDFLWLSHIATDSLTPYLEQSLSSFWPLQTRHSSIKKRSSFNLSHFGYNFSQILFVRLATLYSQYCLHRYKIHLSIKIIHYWQKMNANRDLIFYLINVQK